MEGPKWWQCGIEEEDEVQFPDLDVDSSPQLQQVVEVQGVVGGDVGPEMPELVEGSNDDDGGDDDQVGENDEWGPEDDAPVIPVRGGVGEGC